MRVEVGVLDIGRSKCGDLRFSGEREWLVTNGIGGYASGTISGMLTRRYHGLLIAALQPPVGRTLLLTKLDEAATYGGISYPLFTNHWIGGQVEPAGFLHLERFHLEGTTPVWTFGLSDALLEKRVWMQSGANTTYIRYDLRRATAPLTFQIEVIANCRDHHQRTRAPSNRSASCMLWVKTVPHGLCVTVGSDAVPFYVLSDRAEATPRSEWVRGYYLSVEDYRGLDPEDDNLSAGLFQATLQPGESLTLVASTAPDPGLDSAAAYAGRQARELELLDRAGRTLAPMIPDVERLVLAADQFVVQRRLPDDPAQIGSPDTGGRSIIAGYPWFSDWGRDTMISLPGLVLTSGRCEVAARILRTFGHYISQGMLPNRFPDEGQEPEYNTVDATLWYFQAIRAYHAATGDLGLVRDLFPGLADIVGWHVRGTRYQINVDPVDGLLYAGEPGVQLTWMDAKVDDWVVTPRIGKPVEVNALWHNALCIMAEFARMLGEPLVRSSGFSRSSGASIDGQRSVPESYEALAAQSRAGFARFWNEDAGYCYDVLDGPDGNDPALRPNQLLAVSLPHSPLPSEQQKAVVDACARHLLTSHGLRSLAPSHPDFIGHYGGDRRARDASYHQGTTWGWLIGPFVSAHLRVYRDPALARSLIEPLFRQLESHGAGSLSEIFDGDPPFTPRGCIAQAWTVAEVLRVWQETLSGREHFAAHLESALTR